MPRKRLSNRVNNTPQETEYHAALDAFTIKAREHSTKALEVLADLMLTSPDSRTRAACATKIIEWAIGRPVATPPPSEGQTLEITITPEDSQL